MAVDQNLQLFNNDNLTVGAVALSSVGATKNIGKTGLHQNSVFTTVVQKQDAARELYLDLELTLDGTFATADATGAASTENTVCTNHYPANSRGLQSTRIGLLVPWQEYTAANISLRCVVRSPTGAAGDWDNVEAYIGSGESQHFGRQPFADTLITD